MSDMSDMSDTRDTRTETGAVNGELAQLKTAALSALAGARTLAELDGAKSQHLGRRSLLAEHQRRLGQLDEAERRRLGAVLNALRSELSAAEGERRRELERERDAEVLAAEALDVTLPPRTPRRGSLHPIHETMEAMVDGFIALGYESVTGPEVESDWFSFEALNIPADHPARSLWDTIYLEELAPGAGRPPLRPHTSPVQARIMLSRPPPVYVVVPGRTFRQDTPDATHLPVFHQLEGLAVDTDLSFADLRGTLAEFCRALLGPETRIRLRPDYFPFTEPSCEVDAFYRGEWIELLGAGMVHPNVLRNVGYDPDEVQGFAFGMGIDRFATLRHGLDDIRLLAANDVRFLSVFV